MIGYRDWLAAVLRGEAPAWHAPAWDPEGEELWKTADREGLLPLLHRLLKETPTWATLPEPLRTRLTTQTRKEVATEMLREAGLQDVLALLDRAEIRPLLLKGTPLAYTLYPEPHLRPRCDTDLLFPDRATAERAWGLLAANGFERPPSVTGDQISMQFTCVGGTGRHRATVLDIHWRLSNLLHFAQRFEFQDLAAEAIPVPPLGPSARTLSPAHALLLACMHRIGHSADGSGDRLLWLYDIHLLAANLDVAAWQRLTELALTRGLATVLLDGLGDASALLGTQLPEATLAELRIGAAEEPDHAYRASSRLGVEWFNLRAAPGIGGKLHFLREHLFPSPGYMRHKYGERHPLPLLYLRRIGSGVIGLFR